METDFYDEVQILQNTSNPYVIATVGALAAIANTVVDALWHLGVRNMDIPIAAQKIWEVLNQHDATLEE